jgi:hypothetical protein
MPQYNGVWTIEAAAQAQSNQQWVTDPNFRNTTLLLQADNAANGAQNNTFLDSSSNSFAVTRTGSVTQGTFTPFSQASGGWSTYYTGVADNNATYLATNAAYSFGTGDFTVEAWVNIPPIANTNGKVIVDSRPDSTNGAYWIFSLTNNGRLSGTTMATGGVTISSTNPIPTNEWVHVAYTRRSGTLNLWVNGLSVATASGNTDNISSSTLWIGRLAFSSVAADSWFTGYMSNLRIVKGVAVYTGNFTPQTAPLTATQPSGVNIAAITGSQTSLLMQQSNRFVDNSSIAAPILTLNTWPSIQTFSPFAPQFQWTEPVIGGSGYFPASGSYLTIPANSAFAPGTGDYTVDGWIYSGSNTLQTIWAQTVSGTNYFVVEANYPSSVVQITSAASGGGTAITSAATLRLNAWNHFTVSRTSGVITVWCNGSAGTPTANTVNLTNVSYVPTIGTYSHSTTTNVLIGYLANLRYIKGTALSGATIPTAPNTAVTNTQALLNYTNAGIYDASMDNVLETVGNAQVSTSIVKYGSGSMFFNGTTSYLVNKDSSRQNFNFGTGNFTVEFWINTSSLSVEQSVFDTQTLGGAASRTTSFVLVVTTSGTFRIYTNSAYSAATSNSIIVNTWNHIAMVRNNGTITIYVNGTSGVNITNSTNFSTSGCVIGRYADQALGYLNGYLDDLRVTNGVPRYYQNFIPPQVALPRQ